mgnify:CR=1 FL=1
MAFSIPDVNLASLLPEIVLLAAAAGVLLLSLIHISEPTRPY